MRRSLAIVILTILVFGLNLPSTALARSSVLTQQPSQYLATLDVDLVDVQILTGTAAPATDLVIGWILSVPVGTAFIIKFHVLYSTGAPVTLAPAMASFGFSNSSGVFKKVLDVPVVPTLGQPGNYTYNTVVTPDFSPGPVSVSVLANSLRDSHGNTGPPSNVDSDTTLILTDNSHLQINPPSQPPQPNYTVPALIAALLILALLLFALRRRKKKEKK